MMPRRQSEALSWQGMGLHGARMEGVKRGKEEEEKGSSNDE